MHDFVARHARRDVPAARPVVVSAQHAEVRRDVQRLVDIVADDVAHRQVAI